MLTLSNNIWRNINLLSQIYPRKSIKNFIEKRVAADTEVIYEQKPQETIPELYFSSNGW